MLVDFTIKNYRSFKCESLFSMVAEKKKEDISNNLFNISEDSDISLLKTAVIYGANASGKSNLLLAFDTLKNFILNSTDLKLDQEIPYYKPFVLDVETRNQPMLFEIEFVTAEPMRYRYSVEFDKTQIISEKLVFFPEKNGRNLFERDGVTGKYIWGRDLKGKKESLTGEVLKNVLFLSKAANNNESDERLKTIYRYFRTDFMFHTAADSSRAQVYFTTLKLNDLLEKGFNESLIEFLKSADLGISSVRVRKEKIINDLSTKVDIGHRVFSRTNETGEDHFFQLQDESAGTIKMFDLAGKIIDTLRNGNVLIVDELDSSFHPLMSEYILSIFNDPVKNPKNAQLIVATHDAYLLDSEKLRRDQIWFVEKDQYGASNLYSLDEFEKSEVRKNVPFDRWYLSGRFGALPLIDKKLFSAVEEKE
ncbi:MAG TPA: ATP-binding protein [bacterium]|nr:ATP-binding protein [bacterium]HPS31476.1 ATP-binding protein [bacterium]